MLRNIAKIFFAVFSQGERKTRVFFIVYLYMYSTFFNMLHLHYFFNCSLSQYFYTKLFKSLLVVLDHACSKWIMHAKKATDIELHYVLIIRCWLAKANGVKKFYPTVLYAMLAVHYLHL